MKIDIARAHLPPIKKRKQKEITFIIDLGNKEISALAAAPTKTHRMTTLKKKRIKKKKTIIGKALILNAGPPLLLIFS